MAIINVNNGFRGTPTSCYGYTQGNLATSTAFGVDDSDSGKFKIQSLTTVGAVPTGVVQFSIDPSTNGHIIANPNGLGWFDVTTNLGLPNTTNTGAKGVIEFGSVPFIHNYNSQGAANTSTYIGKNAGNILAGAASNIGIGLNALNATASNSNIAIGNGSMAVSTFSSANVCIGDGTMAAVDSGGGTTNNVFIGNGSGTSINAGGNNVGVGWGSLRTVTGAGGAGYNTCIGYLSGGAYVGAEDSNICIGASVLGTASESNAIHIGTQGSGAQQQNKCSIAGIYGGSGATQFVKVDSDGLLGSVSGSFAPGWQVVTGSSANMAVNNGYIANNSGLCTLTLPAAASVGDIVRVSGMNNATGWQIAQNSGQTIHFGIHDTTTSTGHLDSSATYDSVELVCNITNTDWIVLSSIGNISFT